MITSPQVEGRPSLAGWIGRSALVGGAAGLVLSFGYATPFIVLPGLLVFGTTFQTSGASESVTMTILFVSVALVVAFVVGVFPATALGAATTVAIGWAMWGLRRQLKWWSAALLGLLISAVPALVIAGLSLFLTGQPQVPPLLAVLLLDLPALVYVVAEAVVAAYLYTQLRRYDLPAPAGAA